MPIFEYQCKECEKSFEIIQRLSDKVLEGCPEINCKGELKKLFSATSPPQFKGPGFFCNDYPKSKK